MRFSRSACCPLVTATVSGNLDGTGSSAALRANATGIPIDGGTGWFNTAAFVAQTAGTIGNAGRGILTGPASRRLDLSLFKTFQATERFAVQFRIESFNLTNTANFANPSGTLGTAAYGTISSLQSLATPRQLQLALKLLF